MLQILLRKDKFVAGKVASLYLIRTCFGGHLSSRSLAPKMDVSVKWKIRDNFLREREEEKSGEEKNSATSNCFLIRLNADALITFKNIYFCK